MDVIARTPPIAAGIVRMLRLHALSSFLLVSLLAGGALVAGGGLVAADGLVTGGALVAGGGVASADAAGPAAAHVLRGGEPQLQTRLLVRRDAEDRIRVGVLFDLAPSWHVYWRSSGDTGLPPELSWEIEAASVGPTLWPAPVAFHAQSSEEGLPSYGYVDQVLLASDARFGSAASADATIAVEGDVLVCQSECVPVEFHLERVLGSALSSLGEDGERELFSRFAEQVPVQPEAANVDLSVGYSQSAIRPGDTFDAAISVRASHSRAASFFPDDLDSLELRVTGVEEHPTDAGMHLVFLSGVADPDAPIELSRLTGVLGLTSADGEIRTIEVDLPFPAASADAEVTMLGRHWLGETAAPGGIGLLEAFLLALVGGLVLNLMPCVLPVLAIKVFGISQIAEAAREGRGDLLRHGIAYTSGILGSMALLATCVLVLRSAGHSVGWGFQFQEPLYIAGISAILVAFAANLFGAFEIRAGAGALGNVGQDATGARRSFFEGLLAVALATPCSAPFLGTAVGFAFASEPIVILGIFLAVGLGLAAPFALITLIPSWARFVPRSGPWMEVMRAGLGFALLATIVWLLWIFGGSAGMDGVVTLIGFLLALTFSLWCFGLLQRSAYQRTALAAGLGVILFGVAGLNGVSTQLERVANEIAASRASGGVDSAWQTWSPEGVEAALAQGAPVFVRFTADWCITCKLNERVVLSDEAVHSALADEGFRLFVGDWTHRDEAIRSELARHGRAGVPLYLVYHPARPDAPQLLPELLTVDATLAALRDTGHPQTPKPARSARR